MSCFKDDISESWYSKGIQEFSHLFENVTFLSFAQLQQKYEVPSSPFIYIFFQIKHTVNTESGSLQQRFIIPLWHVYGKYRSHKTSMGTRPSCGNTARVLDLHL